MKPRRPKRNPAAASQAAADQAANPELHAAILAMVDTQLENRQPAQVSETFERLVAAGHTREGARQLIATAVASELFAVMSSGKPYNEARYLAALANLISTELP